MGIYRDLQDIYEYLISIRKLKTYFSFDVELPSGWKIPKKYVSEDKIVEHTSKTEGMRFFSFISQYDEIDMDTTLNNIRNIISYNKEIELKERLLQQKITELKKIFEKTNLDELQSLKFELIEERLTNDEEVFDTNGKGTRVVEE